MAKIQLGRVVIGGVIAGILINASDVLLGGVVLGDVNRQIVGANGAPDSATLAASAIWKLLRGFILGFVALYIYAGIKPRFGASSHAAVAAGIVVWTIHYAFGAVGHTLAGEYQLTSLLVHCSWTLAAAVSATILGSRFYRERAA